MSNDLTTGSSEIEPRWLEELRGDDGVRVRDEPDMPLLIDGRRGYYLPPDFPWEYERLPDYQGIIVLIETDSTTDAGDLGDFLVTLRRAIRRQVRPAKRGAFRLDIARLSLGSVFLELIVPTMTVSLSLGMFVNNVYATYFQRGGKQRALANALATLITQGEATAITFAAAEGITVRIDRPAAQAYLDASAPVEPPEEVLQTRSLPDRVLTPLALPSDPAKSSTGSGQIFEVNGDLYVRLSGREGALVRIERAATGLGKLTVGAQYNFAGHFDYYADGLPRQFSLTEVREV